MLTDILTEFMNTVRARIGEGAARTRLRVLRDKGIRTAVFDEEEALVTGGSDFAKVHRSDSEVF